MEVTATAYQEARGASALGAAGEVANRNSIISFSSNSGKAQLNDKRRSRGDRKPEGDADVSSRMSVATAGGANITIVDDFATSSAADTNRSQAPIAGVVTDLDAAGERSPIVAPCTKTFATHDGSEQIGESINIPINIWNANYDDPSSYDNLGFKSTE